MSGPFSIDVSKFLAHSVESTGCLLRIMQLRSPGDPFRGKIQKFPRRGGAYPRGGKNGVLEDGYKRKNHQK